MTSKDKFIDRLLGYWKVPKVYVEADYAKRARVKFKGDPEIERKVETYVNKKRASHARILKSAESIADMAEQTYGVK